jgi:hypothetical protein
MFNHTCTSTDFPVLAKRMQIKVPQYLPQRHTRLLPKPTFLGKLSNPRLTSVLYSLQRPRQATMHGRGKQSRRLAPIILRRRRKLLIGFGTVWTLEAHIIMRTTIDMSAIVDTDCEG